MKRRSLTVLPLIAALVLVGASCNKDEGGNTGGSGGGGTSSVAATEVDYSITLDSTDLSAGEVTFNVTNDAEQVHEFVVIKTDLAEDQLPLDDTGDVSESSSEISPVDEIEDIQPGSTPALAVTLDAGSYVAICNLPGHYGQGMHVGFTVA